MTGNGTLTVERARALLAECVSIDEVREIRDTAEAVARYQWTHAACEEAAVNAKVIAVRAERRLGELLRDMPKAKGTRGAGRPKLGGSTREPPKETTLADLGVTKKDSFRWQAVADVPEEAFERALAEFISQRRMPTRAGVVRLAKEPEEPPEPDPFHMLVAVGELRDAVQRAITKATATWPEEARKAVPRVLRDLAFEAEVEPT